MSNTEASKQNSKELTKEQLLERGWTEDKLLAFYPKSYKLTPEQTWNEQDIIRKESYLSFTHFTTIEDFQERQHQSLEQFSKETYSGTNFVNDLDIDFKSKNYLLKNLKNYNPLKPIFHLIDPNFSPNENTSYTLFTDGCFKSIGSQSFSTCAGWIIDNTTKEIVIEFSKVVPLDKKKYKGTPNFELIGISEGVKLIKQLGLKKVQCYTDSLDEGRMICFALNNIGKSRLNELSEYYSPIIKTLQETNSSISWLPREFNQHADELTKIPLNAWFEIYKKEFIELDYMKDTGYIVDRKKEIFFHHEKLEYKNIEKIDDNNLTIFYSKHSNQEFILKYNKKEKSLEPILTQKLDLTHIDDSLPKGVKNTKKALLDVFNFSKFLDTINNHESQTINICMGAGTLATCKKIVPINSNIQEEYFALHKSLNEFNGNIIMTETDKDLSFLVRKFHEKRKIESQNELTLIHENNNSLAGYESLLKTNNVTTGITSNTGTNKKIKISAF